MINDPSAYSITEILEWIRTSRDPSDHPKAQAPTKGGYQPTYEGMEQWVEDVMFLLGYVADKDIDRYNDFMGRCKNRDPIGFNALIGSMYHPEEQQVEDVTGLVPTTTVPPTTTTTTMPPLDVEAPPPITDIPPTTTAPPDGQPQPRMPGTWPQFPPQHILPPVHTVPPRDRPRRPHERRPPGGWPWPPPPKGPETRPHSPHAPFWPRVPSDWPYARGPKYGEIPEGDSTLNVGPDDWGAPPGTPASRPPGDAQPTGAATKWPTEGPLKILGDFMGGYLNPGADWDYEGRVSTL